MTMKISVERISSKSDKKSQLPTKTIAIKTH